MQRCYSSLSVQPPSKSHSAPKKEEAWSVPGHPRTAPKYTPSVLVLELPPHSVAILVPKVSAVGYHRGAVAAKPIRARDEAVAGRAKKNVRRHYEKAPVVQRQYSSVGTGSGLGGAGSGCRPSIAKSRGERAGGHFVAIYQDGLESPVQCASYTTVNTPP